MAFDVRAFTAAHEPWSFTDDRGRVWQPARELSALAAARWLARLEHLQQELVHGRLSAAEGFDRWVSLTRRIVRSLFPWRIRYWWIGDPSRAFDRLSLEARRQAIDDLFRSRARRTSTTRPQSRQTTPKPSSAHSPPTRTPTSAAGG